MKTLKKLTKTKVTKVKAIQSAKPATTQQPQYEQRIKAIKWKIMETSEKRTESMSCYLVKLIHKI